MMRKKESVEITIDGEKQQLQYNGADLIEVDHSPFSEIRYEDD
jgi:hypothetical protein